MHEPSWEPSRGVPPAVPPTVRPDGRIEPRPILPWAPGPPLLRPGWRLIAAGVVALLLAAGLVYRYVSPIRTAQLFVESLLAGASIPDIVSYQCGEAGSNGVFDPNPELRRIFNEVHLGHYFEVDGLTYSIGDNNLLIAHVLVGGQLTDEGFLESSPSTQRVNLLMTLNGAGLGWCVASDLSIFEPLLRDQPPTLSDALSQTCPAGNTMYCLLGDLPHVSCHARSD